MHIVLIALMLASGVAVAEDAHDRDVSTMVDGPNDCSTEGRNGIFKNDTGAGVTWTCPNTATWIPDVGVTVNPVEDPTFRSDGGSD